MSPSSSFRRGRGLAALLAASLAPGLIALGSDSGPSVTTASASATPAIHASYVELPTSITELRDRSDVVLTGTVTAVRRGELRRVAPELSLTPEYADVAITTVLHGRSTDDRIVTVRRDVPTVDGALVSLGSEPAYRTGDDLLLFLVTRRDDPASYRPTAPFGRLAVRTDGRLASPFTETPLARSLQDLGVAGVVRAVR